MHDCTKTEVIATIRRDVDNLCSVKDVVIELKTLVALQTEQVKRQEEILKHQSETMIKISETVTSQGEFIKRFNQKFDDLDNKLNQKQISDLQDSSISFNYLLKLIIDKTLIPIIFGAIMYYILNMQK